MLHRRDEPFIREAEKVELAERKCLRGRKNEIRRRVRPIAKTREERNAPIGLKRGLLVVQIVGKILGGVCKATLCEGFAVGDQMRYRIHGQHEGG